MFKIHMVHRTKTHTHVALNRHIYMAHTHTHIYMAHTRTHTHTCMPLRVFMIGMAFRNSGSRQLLLDAVVKETGQRRHTLLSTHLTVALVSPHSSLPREGQLC